MTLSSLCPFVFLAANPAQTSPLPLCLIFEPLCKLSVRTDPIGGSDPLRRGEGVSGGFLGVGEGDGQGVGSVGGREFRQSKHALNHLCNRQFLSATESYNRLLHPPWRMLINLQPRLRHHRECRATRLAHDQRRLKILRKEQTLNRTDLRRICPEDIPQGL